MSPAHVALTGYALALFGAPYTACLLLAFEGHATRWLTRAFALALTVLWLPILCAAPHVIPSLA